MKEMRIECEKVLEQINCGRPIRLLVCSARSNHFDPAAFSIFYSHPMVEKFVFEPDLETAVGRKEKFDVVLLITHWVNEFEQLKIARRHGLADLYVLWIWDNHIAENFHRRLASLGDIIIPAHSFNVKYLECGGNQVLPSLSIPSVQWSNELASEVFRRVGYAPRSSELYAAYFTYMEFPIREKLLRACLKAEISSAIRLREATEENRDAYFESIPSRRLTDWMSFKCSLCLPLNDDLSSRFFDALLAGQIPIVPLRTIDLDRVIVPELQEWLPVIRFDEYNVDSVVAAHSEAVRRFDLDGREGVLRRHLYALENHVASNRFAAILKRLSQFAIHRRQGPT